MIAEYPVATHAHTNISSLQESLYRICFAARSGKEIPRLWFATILAGVIPTLVGSSDVVKEHDVDRVRTK